MKYVFEKDIQLSIIHWLADNHFLHWRNNNIPAYKRRSRSGGVISGLPDIFVVRDGIIIGIEVKRGMVGDHKLSPEQGNFAVALTLDGGKYYTVHSLEEAKAIPELSYNVRFP